MIIHIIIGQRHCAYDGEYAPEALDCIDEYAHDSNPEFLEEKLSEHRGSNEYEKVESIKIEVESKEVMSILYPNLKTIKGKLLTN